MNKNTSTRDAIIKAAVELFNRDGVTNVSLRSIANSIGISVGNLTYHFRKKEDLIAEIVMRLTKDRNIYGYPTYLSFIEFNNFLLKLEERHEQYSFFYTDLANLTRQYQLVHDAEIRANSELKFFYKQVLQAFSIQGLICEQKYPYQYDNLANSMLLISTFWSQEKVVSANFSEAPHSLVRMIWSMIVTCCTPQGSKEFKEHILDTFGNTSY